MVKKTVVINVVQEELECLSRALESVKGWADELILIDMECGNGLNKIAKRFDAKVVEHERVACVEIARNFGISKASGEWILLLDPDEEILKSLKIRLSEIVKNEDVDFVRIPRKNIVFGKWIEHSRWWPDYNIRFFKKGFVKWEEAIHSIPLTKGKGIDLPIKEDLALVHYHYQNISQYVQRMDRYTTQQLVVLKDSKYRFVWSDLIIKPVNEFLSRYFLGEAYKDGVHGLGLALLQSFAELILYLKAWEEIGFPQNKVKSKDFNRVFSSSVKDFYWWLADQHKKKKDFVRMFVWKLKRIMF